MHATGVCRSIPPVLLAAGCLLALSGLMTAAFAQVWPTRTVQVISPFAPGNATDTVARIVMEQVSKQVNQPIVIENRTGAGGTVGTHAVARAAPDGYTLLSHGASHIIAPFLHRTLPYDVLGDFVPVVPFGYQPMVLVVAPNKGFKTLADLIAAAKARPGALNFASAGIGAASHMAAVRLLVSAGIEAQHIPFRGPVEALAEVVAGRIDFYFLPSAPAVPLLNEGKVIALAVSTPKRATALPNVPTTAEAGLSDAAYSFWGGLFAPAQTPREIVNKINQETTKALGVSAVQERLAKLGVEPMSMTVEEFGRFVKEEYQGLMQLAKAANITPQ